jgi:hypothetical protein
MFVWFLIHAHIFTSFLLFFTICRSDPGNFADTYIWPEHLCLEKRFANRTGIAHLASTTTATATANETTVSIPPCHIYVMADRPTTLQLLLEEINTTTSCTYSTIQRNSSTGISFSSEHGPFAGRGYWEDLYLATQARHGMVSFHMYPRLHGLVRTSSALVREIIEFRRIIEYYYYNDSELQHHHHHQQQQHDASSNNTVHLLSSPPLPPPFWECKNPWKER